MIAIAATASDTTSGSACSAGEWHGESPRGPAVCRLEEDARIADVAVRMDNKSLRAISSFQAGSYQQLTQARRE